jgi:hypothetical protein
MNRLSKNYGWVSGIALITILTISIIAKIPAQQQSAEQASTKNLPQITSKVRNLEVTKVTVRAQGRHNPDITLEIKNKSELPIIAFIVTFGRRSISRDGGLLSDAPSIVIAPHETTKLYISLSDLNQDTPVVVSGAFYADGTEDGEDAALRELHEQRKYEREKHAKQKNEVPKQ